jgi:ElaB/YqjD/DUF883 family membrane-anchored ribosome-binding protein
MDAERAKSLEEDIRTLDRFAAEVQKKMGAKGVRLLTSLRTRRETLMKRARKELYDQPDLLIELEEGWNNAAYRLPDSAGR